MNVKRMRAVAARIVEDKKHFNMSRYFGKTDGDEFYSIAAWSAVDEATRTFKCNTSGCFAGHAVAMFGSLQAERANLRAVHDQARSLLDLTHREAEHLFAYNNADTPLDLMLAEEVAAEALRMVAKYEAARANTPSR